MSGAWPVLPKNSQHVVDFLTGKLSRRTMLGVVMPLLGVAFYGSLALAVALFPQGYDWRTTSISKLLYPLLNPTHYFIPMTGIALTGLLLLPFAGYIRRGLGENSSVVRAGAAFFFAGAICLILASVITSHPAEGRATIPKLHEVLARVAGIGLGAGMLLFEGAALPGWRRAGRGWLVFWWSVLTGPALLVIVLALTLRLHLPALEPVARTLRHSAVWNLGFWEWIGSGLVIGFLVAAAWCLPEAGRAG
jgi:hypothetical protein